ncbi:MAG: Verru_Chthon cassette protein D [Verrucomicrobiota bacterium]
MKKTFFHGRCCSGFTLVESLVVLLIILLLSAGSFTAFQQITQSSGLVSGSQMVMDQFDLARQTAITRNRSVEVQIFQLPSETFPEKKVYRALRLGVIDEHGTNYLSKVQFFPQGIAVQEEPEESPLVMAHEVQGGETTLPSFGKIFYKQFRFRPNGSTDLKIFNQEGWYLLLRLEKDSDEKASQKIFCIQIDPATGRSRSLRPKD